MNIRDFDELNKPKASVEIFKAYFEPMQLPDEEKQERELLAAEFEDLFLKFFVMIQAELIVYISVDAAYYYVWLYREYIKIAEKHATITDEMRSDIRQKLEDIVDSTIRQIEEKQTKSDNDLEVLFDDNYVLSEYRAIAIAENESNYVRNADQFNEAKENGYVLKQWLSMRDSRVRDSHRKIDGTIVPIDDYFDVNGSLMRYPMDMSMDPKLEEVVGCRCTLDFM